MRPETRQKLEKKKEKKRKEKKEEQERERKKAHPGLMASTQPFLK
jgi:hypothetical protein